MADENLWIWTTDWHLVSSNVESGIIGETHPDEAQAVCAHFRSLDPVGIIDTGDDKDHFGTSAGEINELQNFRTYVETELAGYWGTINIGDSNADFPTLPGNHDEDTDSNVAGATAWTVWDAQMWSPPYHWTVDWDAPQVRFIAYHAEIVHAPSGFEGFFSVDASEADWLSDELDALPVGWKAIVCSHPPYLDALGNNIRSELGGAAVEIVLERNSDKIAAYLSGHRHLGMRVDIQDGITHFSAGGVAYHQGNAHGSWVPITYLPDSGALRFDFREGPITSYGQPATPSYTPIVISGVGPSVNPYRTAYTHSAGRGQ